MKNKLVSIIIPVFNCENSIKKCVKSVIDQNYNNIEIILINDGSTDNSDKICEAFSKMDSRIQYINKPNTGVSKTRNVGIDRASGEYCCFVDSDDWIEESYISKLVASLEQSDVDWVISGYVVNSGNNQIKYDLEENIYTLKEMENTSITHVFSEGYIHPCWNKIYKTRYLKQYNISFPDNISISEDTLFNIEYFSHCKKISTVKSVGYHYQKIECVESLSQKVYENIFTIYFEVYNRLFSVLNNMNFESYLIDYILIKTIYPQYYASILKIIKTPGMLFDQKKIILNRMLESKEQRNIIKRGMDLSSVRGEKIIVFLALHKYYRILSLLIDRFIK